MNSEIRNYIKIPLVGNKFQERTPSNKDTDILLVKEDENPYDNNAIGVYSRRNRDNTLKLEKLGFIIKDKTCFVRNNFDNLTISKIVRSAEKNKEKAYYYYLLIAIS